MKAPDPQMHALLELLSYVIIRARSMAWDNRHFFTRIKSESNDVIADMLDAIHNVPLFLNNWEAFDEGMFLESLDDIYYGVRSDSSTESLLQVYTEALDDYFMMYPGRRSDEECHKAVKVNDYYYKELVSFFKDWEVAKERPVFMKRNGRVKWYFHTCCMQHVSGFYAIGMAIIEYLPDSSNAFKIRLDLGDFDDLGARRFPFTSKQDAKAAAADIHHCFEAVGIPFLQKYSEPCNALSALKQGGSEAMLVSPYEDQHEDLIAQLEAVHSRW
ncbi:MAG: hypothetical protein ACRBHB_24290 [Arenicella sp.]